MVNLPENCKKENQRWSYATKLLSVVTAWHNSRGLGTDSLSKYKIKEAHRVRNEAIADGIKYNYHGMTRNNLVNGLIVFPPSVRMDNEGSIEMALISLADTLSKDGVDLTTNEDFNNRKQQAKLDAINGTFWSPNVEDII